MTVNVLDYQFCYLLNAGSNNILSFELYSKQYFDSRCKYDNYDSEVNPVTLDNDFRNEIDSECLDRDALSSFMSAYNQYNKLNIFSCNIRSGRKIIEGLLFNLDNIDINILVLQETLLVDGECDLYNNYRELRCF